MAIEKKNWIERVLIVMTPNGEFLAAHQERLEAIVEDGKIIHGKQLPAEPLAESSLDKVLPAKGQVIAAMSKLQSEHGAVVRARDIAVATCEQLEAENKALKDEVAELKSRLAESEAE